jgi:ribosome biogenesis protein ERB1
MHLVRCIRHGVIRINKNKVEAPKYYDLWKDAPEKPTAYQTSRLPAPKMPLPGNEESYNPPEEYLPTERERRKFAETDPKNRKRLWLPEK